MGWSTLTKLRKGLIDLYLRKPAIDLLASLVAACSGTFIAALMMQDASAATLDRFAQRIMTAAPGVSALAGISLALLTFIATHSYQANNPSMQLLRRVFPEVLRSTWIIEMSGVLLSAVLPMVALLAGSACFALFSSILGLSMTVLASGRAIAWFAFATFTEESDREPLLKPAGNRVLDKQP